MPRPPRLGPTRSFTNVVEAGLLPKSAQAEQVLPLKVREGEKHPGLDEEDGSDNEDDAFLGGEIPEPNARRWSVLTNYRSWTLSGIALAASLGLLLAALLYWLQSSGIFSTRSTLYDDSFLSNGTHFFKKTVLLVSLDGLCADYVSRNLTTHLHDISLQGLRAEYMQPIFPSLTFPNHWALMTGLYAESHGIVANTFFDPLSKQSFRYTDPKQSWDAWWWKGEPIWETAEKAGLITANLMWPGPPVTASNRSPTYFVPFKNKVSMDWKHDKLMEWFDLPVEGRPQLITVYEPSVDQKGHKYGPDSPEVNVALQAADRFARRIHSSLAARNLSHIVDTIFVSDHGMVDTSELRIVYVDDIIGTEAWNSIEHNDGWPSYGLRFSSKVNTTDVLLRLYSAAAGYNPPAFDVYVTHSLYESVVSQGLSTLGGQAVQPMPERYHFDNNVRIAPIYIVPRIGWALSNRHEHLVIMNGKYSPLGNHGYDPSDPAMHAIFVADGPFTKSTKSKQSAVAGSNTSSPLVMPGFENVQLHGLVTKLLGISPAQTNGTAGFWDEWLD